jgi:hypothetical protein
MTPVAVISAKNEASLQALARPPAAKAIPVTK